MATNSMDSKYKTESLKTEAERMVRVYEDLKRDNLAREKIMRIKRYKTETLLVNWLHQYDTEIGKLYLEYEASTEE